MLATCAHIKAIEMVETKQLGHFNENTELSVSSWTKKRAKTNVLQSRFILFPLAETKEKKRHDSIVIIKLQASFK